MSFFCRNENKIILLVGDKGTVVVNLTGSKINNRFFIKDSSSSDFINFKSLILSKKNSSIYMVLNNSDQIYSIQNIPPANRIIVNYLVNTKIKSDFSEYDIKAARVLRRNTSDKNWQYKFIASNLNSLSKELLSLIIKYSNNFQGILLFPIELSLIVKLLSKKYNYNSIWSIIIAYTKTNDFRQVVLKENNIVLCNVISDSDDTVPNIIAGKVYQEVQMSIDQLVKFGLKASDRINLYIVVSNEIKTGLLTIKPPPNLCVNILTPYDLAKDLGIGQKTSINDRFCDTTILYFILQRPSNITFHTKKSKLFTRLLWLNSRIYTSLACFVCLMIALNVFYSINVSINISKNHNLVKEEKALNLQLEKLDNNHEVEKINKMYEMISVYKLLSNINYSPLDYLPRISKLKSNKAHIEMFSWQLNEKNNKTTVKLQFNFKTNSNFISQYPILQEKVYRVFNGHNIKISNLLRSKDSNNKLSVYVELEK